MDNNRLRAIEGGKEPSAIEIEAMANEILHLRYKLEHLTTISNNAEMERDRYEAALWLIAKTHTTDLARVKAYAARISGMIDGKNEEL